MITLLQAQPDPKDFTVFFQFILDALVHKQWWPLASVLLIGVVALTRFLVPKIHGALGVFLNTDRGAALLVVFYAAMGAAATTFGAWKAPDLPLLASAVFVAIGGAGGFSLFKKLLFPDPVQARMVQQLADHAKEIALPPPIRPGALLPLIFILSSSVLLSSCACQLPENKNSPMCRVLNVVVSCGGSAVLDGILALVEAVTPAITGNQIDWGALTTLEEKYGTDAVMCALKKAGALSKSRGASPAGLSSPTYQKLVASSNHVVENVDKIFAARHVVVQGAL